MNQYDLKFDTVAYISQSSNFALFLYLEEYLIYKHHIYILWVSMTQTLTQK